MKYLRNLFKNISKPLYIFPVIFAVISITMMISISYNNGIVISRMVIVQTGAYIIGLIAVIIIINIDYTVFEDLNKYLYIGSIILLLTPYLPFIGIKKFGARSWVNIGITTIQPSEFVKILFIFIMAAYFKKNQNKLNSFKDFAKALLYVSPIILIVLKDDFGSAAVFMAIFISMCLFAGLDWNLFGKLALFTTISIPFLLGFLRPHQRDRLTAFLYPNDLANPATYQVHQSKIAIGSGGFFGKGLFHGTQKALSFLPVRESDFIFAVICEEFGFLGGTSLMILFVWFLFDMLKAAFTITDLYGALIIIGVIGMFASQIFENIGMTMGLMPVTGITLPFISMGGSSVLTSMLSVGIVLSICISNRSVAFIKYNR